MNVYFIATRARPSLVKIGRARDIEKRMAELQTGCPYEMYILGSIACRSDMHATGIEGKLHRMLRHSRMRGEWFELSRQMTFVLDRLSSTPCDRVGEAVVEALEECRRQYRVERQARRLNRRSEGKRAGNTAPRST